jgi:uncharacterized damage-inducible protein DinB
MNQFTRMILAVVFLAMWTPANAQERSNQAKTIPDSLNLMWRMVEKDFTSLAEAMPDRNWDFKPSQGEFNSVRTFGEQVKHVACSNEAWARKLKGKKPLPAHCDIGGPNPAKSKAEIIAYLKQSFQMLDAEIAATNADNLLQPVTGPYAGGNRLEIVTSALWHTTDHYGQLVVYLRMNGIVPPASR